MIIHNFTVVTCRGQNSSISKVILNIQHELGKHSPRSRVALFQVDNQNFSVSHSTVTKKIKNNGLLVPSRRGLIRAKTYKNA